MNENNKSNISKDDLLNVREIIEKEMHQKSSDPLFLSDIISIDENKTDKNKLLQSMPLFAAELSKHIEAYCNAMKFFDKTYVEIISSWFSKFKKGNHAHIHNHKGADISGVYYFKSTGDDGDIFFTTPNQYTEMSDVWSSDRFSHSSDEGKLLIFPSYLKHGVTTNLTSSTRISFSFNLKVHEWINE